MNTGPPKCEIGVAHKRHGNNKTPWIADLLSLPRICLAL